jgi:hypothetical protein
MGSSSDLNLAEYCRLFVEDQWRRLSPSTRKSYVEASVMFVFNCTRYGASSPSREWRPILSVVDPSSQYSPTKVRRNGCGPTIRFLVDFSPG